MQLSGDQETVTLCIQDNGPGIPPEQLPFIFDRFYRADCARSTVSGNSGLGLAIAKEIVQAHQGHITAVSLPGEGARFCITLPIPREACHG
jgi:signal transduction histidine kinase